jgi:hypothetical protein
MFLGNTFRFVGVGKVRGGRCWPPAPGGWGACGVWAAEATVKTAVANRMVAMDREIDDVFKLRFSSQCEMSKGTDGILSKKASCAG